MKMNRTIEQWKKCNPSMMAREMSENAIMFAFQDAKDDIEKLYIENKKMKEFLRIIAYPKMGTDEESISIINTVAYDIQKMFSLKQLKEEE